MFSFSTLRITVTLLLMFVCSVASARTEAIKGKRYTLSPQHGPWMVMAAALRDVPEERRTKTGMTAWEAADQLVYELRRQGIPAYTYLQNMEVADVSGRTADKDTRKYIARHEAIAVLAGSFPSADDELAQRVLKYLKNDFHPEFLDNQANGGLLARIPGRKAPLARAHMTTNPLMPASEVKRRTVDPLVQKLNSGEEFSLTRNKGKYSLKIATFRGNSIVQTEFSQSEKAAKHFEKFFGSNLDESANSAWELTQALRSARKLGYDEDIEAYVFHDRYESYVTVGSFDSPQDPRLIAMARRFRAKEVPNQRGDMVMIAEAFTIPRNVRPGQQPDKYWLFDTVPTLVSVP
ncbi:MAG: hypothetical protein R3C59_17665 [Planctomycetaceae bacterium]